MCFPETKKALKMSDFNLKKLEFSPDANPFANGTQVPVKQKLVRSSLEQKTLVDAHTGEVVGTSRIHELEQIDSDHFVKVFSAGIAATYDLTKTGQRTFQAILQVYENAPMSGGFVDAIYLAWFDDGLSGQKLDMSEKTFQRGLKELLHNGFLSPKAPNLFWVNPSLFFRGDRVLFIKEYQRKRPLKPSPVQQVEEVRPTPKPVTKSAPAPVLKASVSRPASAKKKPRKKR